MKRWRGKKKWLLIFLRSIFQKHTVCFEGYAIDDKVGPGNICTNKFTTVSETDPLGGIGNHPQGVRHDYFQKHIEKHLPVGVFPYELSLKVNFQIKFDTPDILFRQLHRSI